MRGSVVDGVLVRGDIIDADVKAIGRELDSDAFATACSVRQLLHKSEDDFAYIPWVDPVTMALPRLDTSSLAMSSDLSA